jgi:hypothetical protein
VALIWLAFLPGTVRGEAEKGFALLEVAVPSLLSARDRGSPVRALEEIASDMKGASEQSPRVGNQALESRPLDQLDDGMRWRATTR